MKTARRSLVARPGVGLTANVVQYSTLRLSEIAVDRAALIWLRHGRKTLKSAARQWTARGGSAIFVAGGQTLDIVNELSAEGLFEARWVVWEPAILQQFAPQPPRKRASSEVVVLDAVGDSFHAAIERAVEAVENPVEIPAAVACHRLAELVLWLQEHGVHPATQRETTTVARLRMLFAGEPALDWSLQDVAARFAMSPATLRRRLGAEGVSFSAVLVDARMSTAMTMLQTTNRAIGHIASDVGYESASRFSVRFRSRFGFAPSAVRGQRR